MISLRLTRALSAPPERVWHAFTDPVALTAWFWPERLAPAVQVDLRPGGRYRVDSPGADMAASGEYTSIDAPKRLAFTWQWDGEADQTTVTIDFIGTDEGTELVLTHDGFRDDAERDMHVKGWSDCLDRLPGWLAGEPS
jgi:uncharacterized protein YndB with AHSA1/START domain